MIVCLSRFQNYTRVMSNDNNNLHILKRIKDIDYKGIISSAVAVYFNIIIEGIATALLPANNSFLFFLSFFFADIINHIVSCDLDNHLYPM
jgi:hypothetical protein